LLNNIANPFRNLARIRAFLLYAMIANALQRPSVIEAVHKGHPVGHEQDGIDAVRAALAAGGDVNEQDNSGWTPLMHAVLECRAQIVKLLLERGADAKLRAKSARSTSFTDHGQSALTIAAGCFINRRRAELAPELGMSRAYIESERAAPQMMVHDLIDHGADVAAIDADGRTPLMIAAMQGWAGVVRDLLATKAAVNAHDHIGRAAIDYADPEHREIIGLLQSAGSTSTTGRSGRTVCDAERALDKLGYETPIIDCIAGQQLRTVLTKFQKDRALQPTGELDAATRRALNLR
jgi:Putative peptidoglycan binding domain/Ankyrin repeats (3 copies)/Ankyrin repeat